MTTPYTKIDVIKILRCFKPGLGLVEAKNITEFVERKLNIPFPIDNETTATKCFKAVNALANVVMNDEDIQFVEGRYIVSKELDIIFDDKNYTVTID